MKFVSWNVNGLRAIYTKGFPEIFNAFNADFVCLQETKMQEGQLEFKPEGYQSYYNSAVKKGYSGTAIFTRHTPIDVYRGIDMEEHDQEGRVLTLEYDNFYLINVYTPNAQEELRRLPYRMMWEDEFRMFLMRLDQKKGVIVCGDLNVAHEEIDLKNPKTNRMSPGFSDQEREKMTRLLKSGFMDTFRALYPTKIQYSWWSYRMNAREKGVGWRIDYFIISERLKLALKEAKIHDDVFGSDHCPVSIEIF
ncbi:MAG: exodeoxyribonuclease III (xth) [Erysipelotrichaceae bacterium]|nr:MAG: exodeoxyribonuclease III [Erysipelotrichaceae bacterium]TXT17322.1 MAG: exodeoxyribonuclease III (xth) [Erysipelotrichaceae bacterium]